MCIKEKIKYSLFDKNNRLSSRRITIIPEDLKQEILTFKIDNLSIDSPFPERIYWILNDIKDYPKCLKCSNPITNFRSCNEGYISTFCSRSCQRLYHFDDIGRTIKKIYTPEEKIERKKHGVESRKQTIIKKYGYVASFQNKEILAKAKATRYKNWFNQRIEQLSNISIPLFKFEEYVGSKKVHDWKCVKCNSVFTDSISNGSNPRCENCYPKTVSNGQQEIIDFIREVSPEVVIRVNDRRELYPLEIDIFLPELKLGIEYNGLYWHSEKIDVFTKEHLLEKTKIGMEKDIKIIHIFEDEWQNKCEIVKSRLKSLLGKSKKVFARKCLIKEVSTKDERNFLFENHIQNWAVSSVRLGLYMDGEIQAIMTFSKSRFNKEIEWELLRYCSKINTTIVGGASKLLSHFVKNKMPQSIISYADRRWSTGNLYKQLGFLESGFSTPNYSYIKNNLCERLNRMLFQKHKLKDKLEIFDNQLSESANMKRNGYFKIWDCGNFIFKMEFKD